ncbi:MAG: hypothetical protein JWM41_2280 [Gemmatimonadetes bacterium]|nr:hypothetical protein [Gemmatimonadota bacterium]
MQTPVATGSTTARDALFVALGLVTIGFLVVIIRALRARAAEGEKLTTPPSIWGVSFIANFFDTFGVGSFATTTTMFRQWRLVRDEQIPGTLNIGYVLPTVAQAYIYTKIVPVDSKTLIALILAAVAGAWLGAGVVASWPRRKVQIGMGLCLVAFAIIRVFMNLNLTPVGGDALGLSGTLLVVGILGNFALGALMTLGIGLYAPCMILVGLLGMNATTAFPIMMGSCAFLMPLASVRFVRARSYDARAMIGMLVAGLPAVLIAALIVKTMPVSAVQWLVVVVVTYTAIGLLRAARREQNIAAAATAAEAQPAL